MRARKKYALKNFQKLVLKKEILGKGLHGPVQDPKYQIFPRNQEGLKEWDEVMKDNGCAAERITDGPEPVVI